MVIPGIFQGVEVGKTQAKVRTFVLALSIAVCRREDIRGVAVLTRHRRRYWNFGIGR